MKVALIGSLVLLAAIAASAQSQRFRVVRVAPYDQAASGEIMELEVEGLGSVGAPLMLTAEDFKLTITQDGIAQEARIRTVVPMLKSEPRRPDDKAAVGPEGMKMRAVQSIRFVVPGGLHAGETELSLSYKGQTGNSISLTILEKPLRPTVASLAVMTVNTSALPVPGQRLPNSDLGWRLERGSVTELFVNPLTDPDDPNSAVLVRFKQGGNVLETTARVKSSPNEVRSRGRAIGFFPARDVLEVDVPAGLVVGPVELEIRLRANGQESEPAKVNATITDANQSTGAATLNAPRLLLVAPTRVGAGQSMLLSLDYRRTLDPDPTKTMVVIEQGTARYLITPERSSVDFDRNRAQDAPVMIFMRTTKDIIGKAQVRVFNQLRDQQSGMSEPIPIEILSEPLAPEIGGVNVATQKELAHLRQMYEMATRAGSKFTEYDPASNYLTIRVRGIDFNPRYVRISLAQDKKTFTLAPVDFSSYSNDVLVVRLPRELKAGEATLIIENRGVDSFSPAASKTFEVCCLH